MIDFIIHFNILEDYTGEFGFDWVNYHRAGDDSPYYTVQKNNLFILEYVYDDTQNTYIKVNGNEELKKQILREYETFTINDSQYHIPYLNILPNHEIVLEMLFTVINDVKNPVITFEKNDAYLVTINGQTNENIKYKPTGKPTEISIKCIKPSKETYIIAKDGKNNIVGKICVKDNRTTYNLDVRVVCVVEDTPKKNIEIDQLIEDFKLNQIEKYLNHNSLNQAFIKTKVEIDKKYHIAFSRDDIEKNFHFFKVRNEENRTSLFEGLSNEYRSRFESNGEKFKGVLIFLNHIDIQYSDVPNGVTRAVSGNEIILFKNALSSAVTYAHEIGHTLGLEHSFLNQNSLMSLTKRNTKLTNLNTQMDYYQQLEPYKKTKIEESEWYIDKYQHKINTLKLAGNQDDPEVAAKIENLEQQIEKHKRTNIKRVNAINENKKDLENHTKKIEKINRQIETTKKHKYKFRKELTNNIMDYGTNRLIFMHWQWLIMQNSIKNSKGSTS